MRPLDSSQRKGVASALYNLANVVFALLVVGPFISPAGFRLAHFLIGLTIFLAAFIVATELNKEPR